MLNICPFVFFDMTYSSLHMEQQVMGVFMLSHTKVFFQVCLQCSLKKLAIFCYVCLFVMWSSLASTRLVFMKFYIGKGIYLLQFLVTMYFWLKSNIYIKTCVHCDNITSFTRAVQEIQQSYMGQRNRRQPVHRVL